MIDSLTILSSCPPPPPTKENLFTALYNNYMDVLMFVERHFIYSLLGPHWCQQWGQMAEFTAIFYKYDGVNKKWRHFVMLAGK